MKPPVLALRQVRLADGPRMLFDGVDLLSLSEREMRDLRGGRIAMIFQDPMTFLNPVLTAGEQVAEAIRKLKIAT